MLYSIRQTRPGKARCANARVAAVRAARLTRIQAFLEQCCIRYAGATIPVRALFAAYVSWCTAQEERPLSRIGWAKLLTLCGVGKRQGWTHTPRGKRGLALRTGLRLRETVPDEAEPGVLLPLGQQRDRRDDLAIQLALLPDLDNENARGARRRWEM